MGTPSNKTQNCWWPRTANPCRVQCPTCSLNVICAHSCAHQRELLQHLTTYKRTRSTFQMLRSTQGFKMTFRACIARGCPTRVSPDGQIHNAEMKLEFVALCAHQMNLMAPKAPTFLLSRMCMIIASLPLSNRHF